MKACCLATARELLPARLQDQLGLIHSAENGTLFLDEIGDLPLALQPKLLRFLQEGEVHTLGDRAPRKVNVRVIAATHKDLEQLVRGKAISGRSRIIELPR